MEELRRISDAILRAIAGRDGQALGRYLDDGFRHIRAGEPPQEKAEFIAAIVEAPFRIEAFGFESLQVETAGNLGVVAGVQAARVRLPDGSAVDARTAFTDVFREVGGEWRVVFAHSVELEAAG